MRAATVALSVFVLALSADPARAFAPGNDSFPGATITGAAVSATGDSTAATAETGEPNPAGTSGSASIWFTWVAVNTGTATIDTFGSAFDTTLGAYTGDAVNALTLVADNNDATPSTQSKVSFAVTMGTTYRIQVNGVASATGAVRVNIFDSSLTPQGLTAGGIPGGDIGDLYFDPNDPNVLFAAVTGSGLFRSSNAGGNWTQIFLPAVANHTTRRLLVSKGTPNLVFVADGLAGAPFTLDRSVDGGATIEGVLPRSTGRATAIAEGSTAGTYFAGVTTDPSAGSVASVYKSTDSGVTWSALGAVGPSGFDIWDIFQFPTGRIVAGTGPLQGGGSASQAAGGVFYSDDGGASWTSVGLIEATIGFAWNGSNLLVAAITDEQSTYIVTSPDGQTWSVVTTFTNVSTGSSNFANRSPVYHASSDTFFVLTVSQSLLQSGTGPGYAWPVDNAGNDKTAGLKSPVVYDLTGHRCFAIKPGDVNTIVMGENAGGDGIFTTTNGGASWAITNSGLNAQGIDFATKSIATGYRYAAANSGFVYFSSGDLESFTKIYRPAVIFDSPRALSFDIADPKRVAVAVGNPSDVTGSTSFRLLLNTDATVTGEDVPPFAHAGWTVLANPSSPSELVGSLLVNGSAMLAGVVPKNNAAPGNYLYQSVNGGTSWTPVTTLTTVGGVRALAFDPTNPNVIYAGAGDNGGFAGGGEGLYPSHADGVYKSTDGGATWAHLDSNAMLNGQSPRKFVIDRVNSQRLWVQADPIGSPTDGVDNHIWESLDAGATWTEIGPMWDFGSHPRGGLALTYISAQDLLILAAGNGVLGQTPGSGSTDWLTGPDLYGDVRTLYEGSLGAGTSSGLYEAATLVLTSGGPGTGKKKHGCGCDLTTGGVGLGTFAAAFPLLLVLRRRKWSNPFRRDI